MNLFNDIQITDFEWIVEPKEETRKPKKGMSEEILKSIKNNPYIITNNCSFKFRFTYSGSSHQRIGNIPEGFYYNRANIPWITEPVSYDKHSPFVADASLVHDWMLFMKDKGLYTEWHLDRLKISSREFRILTSKLFEHILICSGVGLTKARFMTQPMDWTQKFFRYFGKDGWKKTIY